jgi:RecG-like helicase
MANKNHHDYSQEQINYIMQCREKGITSRVTCKSFNQRYDTHISSNSVVGVWNRYKDKYAMQGNHPAYKFKDKVKKEKQYRKPVYSCVDLTPIAMVGNGVKKAPDLMSGFCTLCCQKAVGHLRYCYEHAYTRAA